MKFIYGMYFYVFCKFESEFGEFYFDEMVFNRMINNALGLNGLICASIPWAKSTDSSGR